MSPTELDPLLEEILRELTLRIIAPRWTQFDTVWESAIRVCGRHDLGKSKKATTRMKQARLAALEMIIFSEEPSAVDGPAQTPLPTPASPDSPGYGPAAAQPSTRHPQDFSDC